MEKPLISVSGVRGIIGESFTDDLVKEWAAGFAEWIKGEKNSGEARVVIGRDTRPSGESAVRIAIHALNRRGVSTIDIGVVPTPTVELAVTYHRADGGMIITASHNPAEWNGLKFLGRDGVFLDEGEVRELEAHVQKGQSQQGVQQEANTSHDTDAISQHVQKILETLPLDRKRIAERRLHAVVDPVNGTGALAVPPLLDALGVSYTLVHGTPDGNFAHNPEPRAEHLADLAKTVQKEHADIGFAVDPDADRLALVDEHGSVLSEEYTLALAMQGFLQAAQTNTVVVNLSTSRMVENVAKTFGARVVRTAVGERNVIEGMRAEHAAIGGEGNGGVIVPACHEGRDALVGIALLLHILSQSPQKLSEYVTAIPSYVMVKEKIPRTQTLDTTSLEVSLRRAFPTADVSSIDGIRIDTADGWVHVRPSNTEPVLRIIAEARDSATLETLLSFARAALSSS